MDKLSIQEDLHNILSNQRFQHTMGVAYTATALAMQHNADVKSAHIAGLLHDCAKYMSIEELTSICMQFKLCDRELCMESPFMLHAIVGSYFAKTKYDITEEEIVDSIYYHTTGRPNMSTIEKIIYISDYIEPNRKVIKHISEIRTEAFKDLDKTLLMIFENSLLYLKESKSFIGQLTVEAYDYYKTRT